MDRAHGWTLIVPVKPFDRAKSRIALPQKARADLARAFAHHTVAVADRASSIRTIVVVGAPVPGADIVLPDPGTLPSAIDVGRAWALEHRPEAPVAVLPADLPGLEPDMLENALARCGISRRCFIPDRVGTGTTLVTAPTPGELITAYGPASATRHEALGLCRVPGRWAGLRDDVDRLTDLAAVPAWPEPIPTNRVTETAPPLRAPREPLLITGS